MSKGPETRNTNRKNMVEALMEAIVDGIITIDNKGIIHSLNPAAEKIFGYKKDELIGLNVKVLMPDPYQSEHDSYLSNYHRTGDKKIIGIGREVLGLRKNGEIFPLELAINDMAVDGKPMFTGIVRDISERKNVEQALISSNQRLSLATEASGAGVWEFNAIKNILVWDDQMFEIYKLEKSDFSAVYDAWRNALHPEDLASAEEAFSHTVETGKPFNTVFRIIWPDDSVRYVQAHAQAILSREGRVERVIGVNTDITKAKMAEFDYLGRESRIRALMDTIVDGIIVISDKGLIQSMNPAAELLFGYQQEEIKQKNIKILMPEPYRSSHDGYLDNYRRTGSKKIIGIGREVVGLRRDGSTFPMELSVSEAEVGDEKLYTGIVRDISERKEVFDQLNLQSSALEAAANAILITDADGLIEWTNSAFTLLTGYLPDEVKGKSTRVLKSGKQSPAFYSELWKTVNEGRVWQGEMINKRKDGSLYTEEQTITPVFDSNGNITNFIAIKLDITERKLSEEKLAQKTRELAIVADFERTQSKVIALFNTHNDVQKIFQLMLETLADSHHYYLSAVYLFDEWQGNLSCSASLGLPKSISKEIELGEGLIGQAASSEKQIVISATDSSPFRLDVGVFDIQPRVVVINPVFYAGKILGVLVVSSLTEMSGVELSFLDRLTRQVGVSLNSLNQYQHLKSLSEELKKRGKEVSQKNSQLEQSNKLKTEFLANMSHELRTPLNAIIGFSEVLKDKLLGELNDEQIDYIGEIFQSANHLLSLINDILDLSKIEAGKMELLVDTVDLRDILRNAVSIIKEEAHSHGITIVVDVDERISYAQVDSRKFKQILFNLLSNAVKFTPDGGSITLTAKRDNKQLLVSVVDTGIGIAEDKANLLFQPFVQLDGSLSRHYEGTGLGLAMVKRLVELHNGTINLKSELNKGSCFSFMMPYMEDEIVRDADHMTAFKREGGKEGDALIENDRSMSVAVNGEMGRGGVSDERDGSSFDTKDLSGSCQAGVAPFILVVEGDEKDADLVKLYLEDEGFLVEVVSGIDGGLEAIDRVGRLPDLIAVEFAVLEEVDNRFFELKHRDGINVDIPMMVMSANKETLLLNGVMADAVLSKPVRRSEMVSLVNHLVPEVESCEKKTSKILLIDDDPKAIKIISSYFAAERFNVFSALSGIEGLELLDMELPDLIVVDLMMPEMSGFEVLKILKSKACTKDIPVIILTAKLLTPEDREELSKHAVEIAEKSSLSNECLLSKIDMLLGRAKKR